MNINSTAKDIVAAVGGPGNISNLTHCMTRLRFSLVDNDKADLKALEKVKDVKGVVSNVSEIQVIIGPNVDEVFKCINNSLETGKTDENRKEKKSIFSTILDLFSSAFAPLIPAIMGAGFIAILLALLKQLGIMSDQSSTYQLLNGIANAVYYFFPVLIAYSLAGRLKTNQVFAIVVACFLVYPDFMNILNTAKEAGTMTTFFGIPVLYASYSKQIIPIFFSVVCLKYIEEYIMRYTPKAIRSMVGSGLVMIIAVLITITILGPSGAKLTEIFNACVYFIVDKCGWVAVPIMAFLNPFFLATGLGSANFPIMLMSYINNGYEALILPAALAGNAVQAGAGFAIAYKSKNKELKSVAMESGITALMGITEPIIFSVHYRLKKTFITVMIASGIAAILPGITHVACYAMANGILSLPAYLPGGVMNLLFACITLVLSVVIGFVAIMLTKFDDPEED